LQNIDNFSVKLYADGADINGIRAMAAKDWISGFTTNPTLMRNAGVTEYASFAKDVLSVVPDRSVSFEVFADDFDEMYAQAMEIASWGENVFVKIPVTNTEGTFSGPLLTKLSAEGVQLNVTAIFSLEQVRAVTDSLDPETAAIVSVFAGRVADTGVDPVPLMREAVKILQAKPESELLWASPRELLNVIQANECGCHIITATNDILAKLASLGKDLEQFSLETVQMFYRDASSAGYTIKPTVLHPAE
jgi:transaldolase